MKWLMTCTNGPKITTSSEMYKLCNSLLKENTLPLNINSINNQKRSFQRSSISSKNKTKPSKSKSAQTQVLSSSNDSIYNYQIIKLSNYQILLLASLNFHFYRGLFPLSSQQVHRLSLFSEMHLSFYLKNIFLYCEEKTAQSLGCFSKVFLIIVNSDQVTYQQLISNRSPWLQKVFEGTINRFIGIVAASRRGSSVFMIFLLYYQYIYIYNDHNLFLIIRFYNIILYFNYMFKRSLYLITGNKKKLEEFTQILGNQYDFQTENIDLPQLQGDPELIASEKALIAFKQSNKPVLVQDTSLCFNAYKGLPGPYIKWFLKNVGPEGLAKMVEPFEDKTGYAMCIIAYMSQQLEKPQLFIGKTPGKIVEPRGSRDFGWDPVFEPDGYDQTYAQLPKQIKNTISHRFRAIDLMRKYFEQQKQQKPEQSDKKQ